ncbi:hypothetical protein AVEN_51409-1 [Araneus ventricosus]|uniref:Uncharacterized protein n=1 Tax=Araneus ventricosus TaxID=182803 RepID=A0A4Y2LN86_ARAVE|nr:hypothetical protein AVEN_51409-1 [Araneus ventricosus]
MYTLPKLASLCTKISNTNESQREERMMQTSDQNFPRGGIWRRIRRHSWSATLEEATVGKIIPLKTGLQPLDQLALLKTPLAAPSLSIDVYYSKLNSSYPKHSSLT